MSEVHAMISRVSAKTLFARTILAFVAFAILPARAPQPMGIGLSA